jgi:hypothetical protein
MARPDRSYAQEMQEYIDEKKFLRKVRHRVFHPDYDSPLLFRLGGYFLRFIIFAAVLGAIFFVRNRNYFSGPVFRTSLQAETDHYMSGIMSEMDDVIWKNDVGLTSYTAQGGPEAFFKSVDLQRITARAKWLNLLTGDWHLRDVGIGDVTMSFKSGSTSGDREKYTYKRSASPFLAIPDFSRTRFGEVTLHSTNFSWGPHWTSKGSLNGANGSLKRDMSGAWEMTLKDGVYSQNWLKNLRMNPGAPLKVIYKDSKVTFQGGEMTLGKSGKVTIDGTVSVGEAAEFDLDVVMKTIQIEDIIPEAYQPLITGLVDVNMKITGSPNRSDGIVMNGDLLFAEACRIRDLPILRTLSVITPQTELRRMPLRSMSKLSFTSRKGALTVKDIELMSGVDVALIRGGFTYYMDTKPMEHLVVDTLKDALEEDGLPTNNDDELGFFGEIQIGMPWSLLGQEPVYREKYFTQDDRNFGWLKVPIIGAVDEITAEYSKIMDHEWADLTKQARVPAGRGTRERIEDK